MKMGNTTYNQGTHVITENTEIGNHMLNYNRSLILRPIIQDSSLIRANIGKSIIGRKLNTIKRKARKNPII